MRKSLLPVARKFWLFLFVLIALACNLPQQQPTITPDGFPSPQATSRATTTSTPIHPTASPSPTATEPYATPSLFIAEATRCRSGPGEAFEILKVIPAGTALPILGTWEGGNYWLVRLENGRECWMWGGAATPQGSLWAVTPITPPPTPTLAAPGTPQNLRYTYSCEYVGGVTQVSVALSWNESPRAQGYRIYRNGQLVAELPLGNLTFSEVYPVNSLTEVLIYSVEAFNAGGAARKSISFSCQ